ncbi:hypothetical protein GCM10023065_20780 [Microbacterium laevaniformans]|nr:hypothetical protein GCM10017578_13300 [Microbacterium laevaniformans]
MLMNNLDPEVAEHPEDLVVYGGALRRSDVGSLTLGTRADLVLLDAPTRTHLAYRPGVPLVRAVYRGGELIA